VRVRRSACQSHQGPAFPRRRGRRRSRSPAPGCPAGQQPAALGRTASPRYRQKPCKHPIERVRRRGSGRAGRAVPASARPATVARAEHGRVAMGLLVRLHGMYAPPACTGSLYKRSRRVSPRYSAWPQLGMVVIAFRSSRFRVTFVSTRLLACKALCLQVTRTSVPAVAQGFVRVSISVQLVGLRSRVRKFESCWGCLDQPFGIMPLASPGRPDP
jgi:hypothetical protein